MAFVELEQRGHVGLITINRPEVLNALNLQVLHDLDQILDQVEATEDIYVLVITGAGRSFVAGADIGEMAHFTASDAKTFSRHGNSVLLRMTRFPRPIIAAVNGYALGGGCELAMSCDIRIGSDKAKFGMPEVGLGITPASAAPSVCSASWACPPPWSWCSPAAPSMPRRPCASA